MQVRSGGIGVASSVRPERWRHFQTHWAFHLIGGAADRRYQGNRQIGPRGMKAAGEALATGCVSGHGRSGSGRLNPGG
jgi:hypothetical protein